MSKQDRQGVRTPADLERKYDLDAASEAASSEQLSQLNQQVSQFIVDTDAKLEKCVKEEEMDGIVHDAILDAKANGEFDDIGVGGSLSASVEDGVLVLSQTSGNLSVVIENDTLILS